ncbi:lipopolysaccharide biosynthesis protein [Chondrinema litorale]|uniref:lipopolysaccharide biosynthesis protein n=1 Tax=Chondrinema litorale TaxID=2994555 RepID=UPI00254338FB|nr:polysaccharide biosynthesis C-terminal domain-containing protein [Chondrinema litorale]UZR94340.1 polysaccharide biosynthesis C-terminal domain-containing protein [Chondrinema litorale]
MIRKLASETAIYGGTTILVRLISYALTPLHVTIFAPESFGIISEFYTYAVAANVLYTYGMETAFFRLASKKSADKAYCFNTAFSSVLLTSILFSSILYLLSKEIAVILGYPDGVIFVKWLAILFAVDAIVALPFARLRLLQKPIRFASIKILNAILILLLNAFFLYFCRDVYEGKYFVGLQPLVNTFYNPELGLGYAFLANLIANMMMIPLQYDAFLQFKFRLRLKDLKPFYKYGLPIMFAGFAFAINETSDRILLKYWLPKGFYDGEPNQWAVGVYSACYKLSVFITMSIQAFKYAAEPFFFAQAEDKNAPKTYASILDYFIIFCCVVIVLVVANLHILSMILVPNKEYWVGLGIVPILLFANLFQGVYYNLAVWYKVTDRTQYGAYMSAIGAVITVTANFFLIPIIGYMGSAWATLLCYFSICVMSYLWGMKFYPINYNLSSSLKSLFLTVIVILGIIQVNESGIFMELIYKNLLALSFLALLFFIHKSKFSFILKKI